MPSLPAVPARLALLVLAVTACSGGLGPDETYDTPRIEARASAPVGGWMDVTIRNESASTWRYNPCASVSLERRQGDAWVRVPDPLILCAPDETVIRAGARLVGGVGIPLGVPTGTHRVRITFRRSDGVEGVAYSGSFVVVP